MEGNPAASAAINNELKMLLEEGELCQEVGGWVGSSVDPQISSQFALCVHRRSSVICLNVS